MPDFLKESFEKGEFIKRALIVWAMIVATAVMYFVCKMAWNFATADNIETLIAILIAPVTALVAFLSGSYNKWGNSKQ